MADSTAVAAGAPSAPSVASSSGPAAPRRLENTSVCLPIVYGSVAYYLGKKADDFQTHEWTLYLRGPNGDEDLSLVISKVVFQLHASFAQPTREISTPPYELTERGWGEFEAQIRIVWKDPLEKSTVVAHVIKLYPPGAPANAVPTNTEPVVAEEYDEVVFTDPTESFHSLLRKLSSMPSIEYSQHASFGKFSDSETVNALLEAQKFLKSELAAVKERLRLVDADLDDVDEALRQAEEAKAKRPSVVRSPKKAKT